MSPPTAGAATLIVRVCSPDTTNQAHLMLDYKVNSLSPPELARKFVTRVWQVDFPGNIEYQEGYYSPTRKLDPQTF